MKLKIIKSIAFRVESPPYFPHLGLSTIYSYLKERGFDITQEDLNIINHPPEKAILRLSNREKLVNIFADRKRIIRYLRSGKDDGLEKIVIKYLKGAKFGGIDILLISIFPFDFCSSMMSLLIAGYFKSKFGNKPVIMGGENQQRTFVYKDFELYNKLGAVDYYILGFGEESLYMLLKKINGEAVSFGDIPGLCYSEDGKIKRNGFASQVLTVPDFTGLPLELYTWKPDSLFKNIPRKTSSDANVLILPFQIVCGCPNRCAFCEYFRSTRLHHIKPREAVKILKRLSERYKTKYFFFMSNTLNISNDFINEFCDEIINSSLNIFWSDCVSIKHIDDPEVLIKMRKAGACRLIFGLETASPRLLHHIDKDITPEQASKVFKWSHEAGIWTGVEIIAGFPQEKDEDVQKTMEFLNENMEYIDDIWLNKFFLTERGSMFINPARYGITNVREPAEKVREMVAAAQERYRYIFDEIDGLKWEDKNEQINHSFNAINALRRNKQREPLEAPSQLHMLFYLYTHLSSKNEIRNYYARYRRLVYLRRLLPKTTLPWTIWSKVKSGTLINSFKEIAYTLRQY